MSVRLTGTGGRRVPRLTVGAADGRGGDNSYEISELQDALIRAGVIGDPWDFGDDHHELDGPWARCLTADERAAMGLGEDGVDRLARGEDDTFVHVVGEGWLRVHRW